MRRPLALRAEILDSLDQPDSEEALPEAIHRYARGERIRWIHHPSRQSQPVLRSACRQRRQNRGNARIYLLSRTIVGAAQQQVRVAGSGIILHHHDGWETVDEPVALRAQIEQLLVSLANRLRRVPIEEAAAEFCLLRLAALSDRELCQTVH